MMQIVHDGCNKCKQVRECVEFTYDRNVITVCPECIVKPMEDLIVNGSSSRKPVGLIKSHS